MPKFYNKDASLTDYALSCGYIERANWIAIEGSKQTFAIELYKEHACYHVRKFLYDCDGGLISRIMWDSFDNVTDARKCYKRNGGQYNVAAMQSYNSTQTTNAKAQRAKG